MPSFSIPLSGLNASSNSLSVIANNLANLNTVGFKAQRTLFQDLFYQQIGTSGSGNPIQQGVGVAVSGVSPTSRRAASSPAACQRTWAFRATDSSCLTRAARRFIPAPAASP